MTKITFMDYGLAQSLSLVFYMITLVVYNRARKEYVGGKIAAAINLIMVSLGILFLYDFADYFSALFLPIGPDTKLIIKILLKLVAIGVLFFGGLRFFVSKPAVPVPVEAPASLEKDAAAERPSGAAPEPGVDSAVALKEADHTKPSLGRYEIIEQIGQGAMGIVYKGFDPKLDRLTAIKTIRFTDDFEADEVEKVREQFYREAKIVAKLNHPNIMSIYDVGEDLDLSYLALEYLEGESLERYTMPDNLLPVEKCIDILQQVCEALDYLHQHHIVHRDIKPANIMILNDGRVKVADFGISRAAAGSRTRTGIVKGTPYYMSPEQIKGVKVTGPSDIFSLGVVFYQMLTGRLPFYGTSLATITYQITTENPESPLSFNKHIDRETLSILNRALAKSLNERYQTAGEMRDHLRALRLRLETEIEPVDRELDTAPEALFPEMLSDEEEKEGLDFSDLEQILETGEEAVEHDLEAFDRKSESDGADEVMAGPSGEEITGTGPAEAALPSEKALKPEDSSIDTSPYSPEYAHTETIEYDALEVHAEPDADETDPQDIQGKTAVGFQEQLKNPVVIIAAVVLVLFGIYSLFFKKGPPGSLKDKKEIQKQTFTFNPDAIEKDLKQEDSQILDAIKQERQKELKLLEQIKKEEKQKEEDRLAKLEEQKQKEAQRLADIAEKERKEKERLAKIAEEKRRKQERLERIQKEKQKERERLAKFEQEKTDALRQEELKEIERLVTLAKEHVNAKDYSEAKKLYETALEFIDGSRFKHEARFSTRRIAIEKALESEDIEYGIKGYVKYRDKWMPPSEREKMLYEEGFIRYGGKFVHYLNLKDPIERFGYPVVRSFLSSKYSGRLIHKKQINLRGISLKQNTRERSRFLAFFSWEVWTFKEIGRGECPMEIEFHAKENRWKIVKGCE